MTTETLMSRRTFLALAAAGPVALRATARSKRFDIESSVSGMDFGRLDAASVAPVNSLLAGAGSVRPDSKGKHIPVGLELYSVRDELAKDLVGTVAAVAKMGYQVVEFYAPYLSWTPAYAKQVRKLLDDLGIRCHSTHNSAAALSGDPLKNAIELNQIIGSKYLIMASAGEIQSVDGWKTVAQTLTAANETLKPLGLGTGFHNHRAEWVAIDGQRPLEVIAANTPKEVVLQLDVGTCLEAGADPVAWIKSNPGRIRSVHCKDWSAGEGKGYRVLFGEGDAPWSKIFQAAQSVGGVEYYLIEQEGSRFSSLETAQRCLATWKSMRSES